MTKRIVKVGKKKVTFSSRTLKSGETAYYRSGKRVKSAYQARVARGVLSGKTYSEARGHLQIKGHNDKKLSAKQIRDQEEFRLGQWAQTPKNDARGQQRATYYLKVSIKTSSAKGKSGSPLGDGEVCTPATAVLLSPDTNDQRGLTYREVANNFERYALFTIGKYGWELCTDNLAQDLISIWRHARR